MNQELILGDEPVLLRVKLISDATFKPAFRSTDNTDWASGSVFELRFDDATVWTATVTGPRVAFYQDVTSVNTLITAHPVRVDLWQVVGSEEDLKARGSVVYL